jgi:hypothetical protein
MCLELSETIAVRRSKRHTEVKVPVHVPLIEVEVKELHPMEV